MIFDYPWHDPLFSILPVEIWLIIKKFYIRNYLEENLFFPQIVQRRKNHDFFADHWQAYMRHHRWDIEIASTSQSALISHYFKSKRLSMEWSGVNIMMRERIFGVGFNINQLFLESIFLDEDYMEFLPSIEMESSDDESSNDQFLFY